MVDHNGMNAAVEIATALDASDCSQAERSPVAFGSGAKYVESLIKFAQAVEEEFEELGRKADARVLAKRRDYDVERRNSRRTKTVLRTVQIAHNEDEGLATCRNLSDTGVSLRVGLPMQLNDPIRIKFSPASSLSGRVVWVNGPDCGIAFDDPIDSTELLAATAAEMQREGVRAPRLRTSRTGRLVREGRSQETVIHDISQRGMKVTHDGTFQPGLHVKVMLDDRTECRAVVRWTRENIAGLMLLEPLGVAQLGSAKPI